MLSKYVGKTLISDKHSSFIEKGVATFACTKQKSAHPSLCLGNAWPVFVIVLKTCSSD